MFIQQGKKNWKFLLIVIILAAIVGGGIWWWQYRLPPEEVTCKNQCGDGTCQEMVCMAVGCPCPETKDNCPQDCGVKDETAGWQTYRNEEYGFEVKYPSEWSYKEEIPQPQNFGVKTAFKDSQGEHILTIQNPIPEIGYESWTVTKTEKIKIQNNEKYLTKKILESKEKSLNNLILVTWSEDDFENSGQITLGYKEIDNLNIRILDQVLSTFRFIE